MRLNGAPRWFAILAFVLSAARPTRAADATVDSTGRVYEKGSGRKKVIYNYFRREERRIDEFKISAHFDDLQGKEAVAEELIERGGKIQSYKVEQKQAGESGSIEIRDKTLLFSYTADGKTRTGEEPLPENFIVGPTIVLYLKAHWFEIMRGDSISARLGVIDRRETVGFKFYKVEEYTLDGKAVVRVKMKPSSFLIASVVDPIYLTALKEDGRVILSEGATLLRQKEGDDVKNLSADVVFD